MSPLPGCRTVLLVFTLTAGLLVACGPEQGPTVPDASQAKGGHSSGGSSPTVDGVDPSEAPQDTTLDITVSGSGFEDGSTVELAIDGVATDKIHTNSTGYVNPKRLVANITIDADAATLLYDVIVITPRGKKGIGTESFKVVTKQGSGQSGPEVLSMTVEQFDITEPVGLTNVASVDAVMAAASADDMYLEEGYDASTFFGCPDVTRPCNRITTTFLGNGYVSASLRVSSVVEGCRFPATDPEGGCVYADEIDGRWNLAAFAMSSIRPLPFDVALGTPALRQNPDGSYTMITYWQGQRAGRYWVDDAEFLGDNAQFLGVGWSFYPDLSTQDMPDRFVFRVALQKGSGSSTYLGVRYHNCPPTGADACTAVFQGEPATPLYLTWDPIRMDTVTQGRGKKATTESWLTVGLAAFTQDPTTLPQTDGHPDYLHPITLGTNPTTATRALLKPPTGPTRVFLDRSIGRNPDDPYQPNLAKTEYRLDFAEGYGCYEMQALDVISIENDYDRLDQIDGSWTSWALPGVVRTLRVDHTADGTTWELGGTCEG